MILPALSYDTDAGSFTQIGIHLTHLACRRQIEVPFVSVNDPSQSDLTWTFKLLLGKHTETSIWHASQFVSPL
jgi:hypothetical protein